MIPNINPREMEKMMKKIGMKQENIDAEEVVISCKHKKIIVKNKYDGSGEFANYWGYGRT